MNPSEYKEMYLTATVKHKSSAKEELPAIDYLDNVRISMSHNSGSLQGLYQRYLSFFTFFYAV
jgi:hypothetical protein